MPEINLRRELVDWLRRRGHWVVLRSFSTDRRTAEADDETGQDPPVPQGIYKGRAYTDHLIKADNRNVVPMLETSIPIGQFPVGALHYYLECRMPVKVDDLILEIELDTSGKPVIPVKIRSGFKVMDAQVMRDGAGITPGRVEFYQVRVSPIGARP